MKLKIAKKVMACDVSPVAMFFSKGKTQRGAQILGIVIQFIWYRRKESVKKYQKILCSKVDFWLQLNKKNW